MKQLTILIDLDAIIIDLIRPWLGWHNSNYGGNLTIDDLTTYKIEDHTKTGHLIYKFFKDVTNYEKCPVLPGASEGLRRLHEDGHDIIIASATAGSTANSKWRLVEKAAPWLSDNNVMVGARKEKLRGDVFIDDAPKNLIKYRKAWPDSHILTIAYPYNLDCKSIVNCYAQDHNNTAAAWQQIIEYILEID